MSTAWVWRLVAISSAAFWVLVAWIGYHGWLIGTAIG